MLDTAGGDGLGITSIGVNFRNRLNNENIKNYLFSGAGLSVRDYDNNGLPVYAVLFVKNINMTE